MLRLAASLTTVTAVVEIALRNAVCDRLTDHFGVAPAGIPHVQLSKVRQAAIPVPMGQVVAQLTMYFWKRLF
ncbi:hypothetical protein [Cupriavidus basilensis]|nr:hypothetical protein [Cupriavidus basilensis]